MEKYAVKRHGIRLIAVTDTEAEAQRIANEWPEPNTKVQKLDYIAGTHVNGKARNA